MRKILAMAWNDVKIEFSDRSTILFFLILPIVFTTIIGVGLGGVSSQEQDNRIALLVLDADGGDLAARFVAALSASQVVRPVAVTASEADAALGKQADTLVAVPAGLSVVLAAGEPATVMLRRTTNDTNALAVEQAVRTAAASVGDAVAVALASVGEAEALRPFADAAARAAYFGRSLASAQEMLQRPPVTTTLTAAPTTNVEIGDAFSHSSAGQMVTWVMITLLGAAEVLVNERLGGTLRRLLVTPTQRATIIAGKVVGRLGMGLVQMALLIGFGAFVLGVSWGRSPLALVMVVVAFALTSVAFGVMLATFARTRNQAGWLAVFFSMLMGALGGAWWPLEVTPPVYQSVVRIFPTTWAMRGFLDVIVRGQGVSGVYPEVLVLLGFAVVFFAVGIRRFRFE